MTRMKTKDFFGLLEKDDKINWAHQTKLLKKLMGKFSDGEIIYAMNFVIGNIDIRQSCC